MFHVKHLGKIFYGMNLRCKLTEVHLRFFLLYGELLYNVLIKQKTIREDTDRYMWNCLLKQNVFGAQSVTSVTDYPVHSNLAKIHLQFLLAIRINDGES